MKSSEIELHIEELTLHGFSPADRIGILEAIERELARALTEGGSVSSSLRSGDIPRLDGGQFRVRGDSTAEAIGTQIANAVYGVVR